MWEVFLAIYFLLGLLFIIGFGIWTEKNGHIFRDCPRGRKPEYLFFLLGLTPIWIIIAAGLVYDLWATRKKKKEVSFKVAKKFKHRGRKCVVVRGQFDVSEEICPSLQNPFHNGYVEVSKSERKNLEEDYHITEEEITCQGNLKHLLWFARRWYIGFDTLHYSNTVNPDTQTKEHAISACKKIVDELEDLKCQKAKKPKRLRLTRK